MIDAAIIDDRDCLTREPARSRPDLARWLDPSPATRPGTRLDEASAGPGDEEDEDEALDDEDDEDDDEDEDDDLLDDEEPGEAEEDDEDA